MKNFIVVFNLLFAFQFVISQTPLNPLGEIQNKNIENINNLGQNSRNKKEKPNVIVLVIDDLFNTNQRSKSNILTPNLDKLSKNSVVFENANCPAPVCIPSRAATFTGISPHVSGVYMNGGDPWNDSHELKSAETLPELFKRNGYNTYGFGKIYHKPLGVGRMAKNFDNSPIYEGGFGPFPDKKHRVFSKKDKFPEFWGVQSFQDSIFPDVKNTDAVISFIEQKQEKPFFLTLGLWRPHTPFTAPQRFYDLYNLDSIKFPEGYKKNDLNDVPEYAKSLLDPFGRFNVTGASNLEEWKRFIKGYYACVSFVDWNIGRFLEAFKKSDYAENTILVIYSDNGFHLGTKNHWEKNTMWEASASVPLLFQLPNNQKGKVNSAVGLIDIYPTLVELCELDSPKQKLDGNSLVQFLKKPSFLWDKPAITYFGENFLSIRTSSYRFIYYPDDTTELYKHPNDMYEFNNLVNNSKYKKTIKNLKKYIPRIFAKELPGRRN